MKGDRERCLEAGADEYLTKPIRTTDLLEALNRVKNVKANSVEIDTASPTRALGTAEPPVADFDAALDRVEGDRELLEELMGMFTAECSRDMAEIHKSLEARDMKLLERLAHTLKGASATLAAGAVSSAAAALEKQARTGEVGNAEQLLETLRREMGRLLGEIELFRGKVAP